MVFVDDFPREGGKARFVPADIIPADERPDAEYPMVLITGRQLEHWHTGSMTRRATVLDAIEPDPAALIHPLDLAALGALPGDVVTLESRRGEVSLYARADDGTPRGAVFVPFCYYEAAINKLTNAALDPFAKIPEFKYCAVRVAPGGRSRSRAASAAARRWRTLPPDGGIAGVLLHGPVWARAHTGIHDCPRPRPDPAALSSRPAVRGTFAGRAISSSTCRPRAPRTNRW